MTSKLRTMTVASLAFGLLALPLSKVMAEEASSLSFNVGVTSDYLFRGISQAHAKPAVQAGIDYAHPSGFYVGAWASNVTWVKDWLGKGSAEIDVYGGFKQAMGDFGYDVGFITYNYPGKGDALPLYLANPNTQELYVGGSYKWLSAKYSYATSKNFIGWYGGQNFDQNTRGSNYFEINANYDLGNGWTAIGHLGQQKIKNMVNSVGTNGYDTANYIDWKLGVSKDVGFGVLSLAWSDTNAKGSCDGNNGGTSAYCWGKLTGRTGNAPNGYNSFKNVAKGTAVVSFLKTF